MASRLLQHLVQIGRQQKVSRFLAEVLAGNQAMLRVFAGSGLPMKQQRDGTVVHVTLFLDEAPPGELRKWEALRGDRF
ncbi:MAG: hypothetical protein HGA71_20715 [Azonexaceae bacterium]|nr:hypothetical protein [Azonexaceae bacterium]